MTKFPMVHWNDKSELPRCERILDNGNQCLHEVVSQYATLCPMHGGCNQHTAQNSKNVNQYRLRVYQERLDEFTCGEKVKSLRSEIALMRMLMQAILDKCDTEHEVFLQATRLSELAVKIEKLVASCHRLESNMGLMLDETAALSFANQIVEIVAKRVTDENILHSMSDEIIAALSKLTGGK